MARYCFCGCGRQVRFAEKRFSKWGAETDRILEILESVSTPIVKEDATASARVEALISEGRTYWAYWRAMIHDGVGPSVGDGVQTRADFTHWKRAAGRLAAAHVRASDAERPVASPPTARP